MPVFQLSEKLVFPPPELAEEDGLLAAGGDLSERRILLAYSMGIFPWYSGSSPILWWSPDPRLVLIPEELRISRSLRQAIKKSSYTITMDTAFSEVIRNCADRDEGTWLTDEMLDAYIRLHASGYAHSIESWHEGKLAGGLYGIALGRVFFGESMFAKKTDASKVAFVALVQHLIKWGFKIIDCQVATQHLKSLGAREIARSEFIAILKQTVRIPATQGSWKQERLA